MVTAAFLAPHNRLHLDPGGSCAAMESTVMKGAGGNENHPCEKRRGGESPSLGVHMEGRNDYE